MKKYYKYYLAGILAVLAMVIGFIFNNNSTYAIESILTVSPMEQKMTLYPGESSTGSIKVSNPVSSKETLYYTVSVTPFAREGDNYDPIVGNEIGGGEYNDVVNWVTFSSDSGDLEPNERDEIIYTVNVPKDARGGGQYFAIVVTRTDNPNKSEGDGNVTLKEVVRIASTVYATVSGNDIRLSGTVTDNNISTIYLRPPITTSFMAENTGNTHMEIYYYMQVYPMFSDEEIYTNEEEPSLAIVLPGTKRLVSQEWKDTPTVGIFKVRQTVMFGADENEKSISEKIVIVCPIWLLFVVIFGVVVIVIYLVIRIKSHKNTKKRVETA